MPCIPFTSLSLTQSPPLPHPFVAPLTATIDNPHIVYHPSAVHQDRHVRVQAARYLCTLWYILFRALDGSLAPSCARPTISTTRSLARGGSRTRR